MRDDGLGEVLLAVLAIIIVIITSAVSCEKREDCMKKECEHGTPYFNNDNNECICAERPK